ncbi:AAA family ATPase [Asinibacterium sp. OR53]|uniref:AAA family ATPase n=1 Tax=Asinibacterium sp. OR53 TaxID=925409 RepID=UPI00047ED828|nr:AAA family ATPase [Asinibacterium sp. OR53]
MKNGFIITELRLMGPMMPPAFVKFSRGLNVISGPSNTGKTYIFQCINYMLGSSQRPKSIPVASNYSHCYLEILTHDDRILTLKSDLRGGDFHLFECAIDAIGNNRQHQALHRKHDDKNTENISAFLLNLCGISNKQIKINATGKKRGLSFSDLRKLQLIDEVRIITDKSPLVTGQYTTETAEKSVIKFLVTGNDDEALIEALSKDEIKHRKGKIEMLQELIDESDRQINAIGITDYEDDQLKKIEQSISSLNEELKNLSSINDQLTQKKNVLEATSIKESNIKSDFQLTQARSTILAAQYESDALRLQGTIEACQMLNETNGGEKHCPVCNSVLDDKGSEIDLSEVLNACSIELQKLDFLRRELTESQALLSGEIAECDNNIKGYQAQIVETDKELEEVVTSKINNNLAQIAQLQITSNRLKKYESLQQRKLELLSSRDAIASTISKRRKSSKDGNAESLSSFIYPLCEQVKKVLGALKYPGLTNVSFNESTLDFLIAGQDRELSGKGFRAIVYAAFVIALHQLVTERHGMPVSIIDSPLVTYRKPDADNEDIPIDMAMDFYRYIVASEIEQVIIMENEEPPTDIEQKINHIIFTQSNDGRYGFIPT